MSRRARAAAFAALALVCAALAASLAGRYGAGIESQLGGLRPVVVASVDLPSSRTLSRRGVGEALELRRVPERFAPPDALADPVEAVGRRPRGLIPAGSYVTVAQLRVPGRRPSAGPVPGLAAGREPVEISVAGAAALAAAGDPVGARFDVVAIREPAAGGSGGRTRIVAEAVRLVDLREPASAADGLDPAALGSATATVAVRRAQALRLIEAHNYARELRLIGAGRPGSR